MIKTKTIAQIAKDTSFESIYELMAKYKLERDTVQKDIDGLMIRRHHLTLAINKENQIALVKRKSIIDKK